MFPIHSLIRSLALLVALAVPLAYGLVGAPSFGVTSTPALAQDSPTERTFVGRVERTDAFIGITTDGVTITAYVCDGEHRGIAEEFEGTAQETDGALWLTGEEGTVLRLDTDAGGLAALVAASGAIRGQVQRPDGSASSPFIAEAAVAPAGLYRADEAPLLDGDRGDGWWIVLNTGEVQGNAQSCSQVGTTSVVVTCSAVGTSLLVLPPSVTQIDFDVAGAQGGCIVPHAYQYCDFDNGPGLGGRVTGTLVVGTDLVSGSALQINVGGRGGSSEPVDDGVGPGGFNGGGSSRRGDGGGGGASDIRQGAFTLADRVVVAGGGGGGTGCVDASGGAGGGLVGGDGRSCAAYSRQPAGRGGTATAGGAPGPTSPEWNQSGAAGTFGRGGDSAQYRSGGGGGGWYGGGGGSDDANLSQGGGGGSSHVVASARNVVHTQGVRAGDGQVILRFQAPPPSSQR
jgi:hypothetical protein